MSDFDEDDDYLEGYGESDAPADDDWDDEMNELKGSEDGKEEE